MTELLYKTGDVREDGFIATPCGKYKQGVQWRSPLAYRRWRIGKALHSARSRAKANNIPFDLDIDFLLDIFPQDNKCPVFGINLEWGGDNLSNSPSLDRIVPHEGYIKGNVIWISNRANQIKSDATPSELRRVADFYTNLLEGI